VINRALEGIPSDRVRLHVCWGNSESPHDSDVPLEDILPIIGQANVGALYLPFAGARHAHEFRCFEKFPLKSGQILVAGVIDPLTNIIEHPEVVSDRIERIVCRDRRRFRRARRERLRLRHLGGVGACRAGCGLGEASYSQGRGATRVCETVLIFRCAGIGKRIGVCAVG